MIRKIKKWIIDSLLANRGLLLIKKEGAITVNDEETIVLKKEETIINNLAYYSAIHPFARYAPWRNDKKFQEAFQLVQKNTLITEESRMYELWQLSSEVKDLKGDYIEIGSWRGGSGALITIAANAHSSDFNMFMCDTFTGVVKASEKDNVYKNNEHADTSEEVVQELIKKLNLKNVKTLKGIFPDETGMHVESNNFKFCHIDVDVYESAKSITNWIWDKMVVGGIIVYDDFGFQEMQGVTLFVESQRLKSDRLVIHNLNGHGIIIKTK